MNTLLSLMYRPHTVLAIRAACLHCIHQARLWSKFLDTADFVQCRRLSTMLISGRCRRLVCFVFASSVEAEVCRIEGDWRTEQGFRDG